MDRPLRGEVSIGPGTYKAVLDRMTAPAAAPTGNSVRPAPGAN